MEDERCPWEHLFNVKYCNYSGYVSNSDAAFKLIKEYELATQSHFITLYTAGAFKLDSNDEAFYLKRRVHWSDPGHGARGVKIEFDGTPFIVAGTSKLECQYGPDRKKNMKARKAVERSEHELSDSCKKRKSLVSKKTDCPACIDLRKVYRYPDYMLTTDSQWKRHTTSEKLRKVLRSDKCEEVDFEVRVYILLPRIGVHKNHTMGEAGITSLPIDPRVRRKIQQLVEQGIRNLDELRRLTEEFVRDVLFTAQQVPSARNHRYYPTKTDYLNIRYRAEKRRQQCDGVDVLPRRNHQSDDEDGNFVWRILDDITGNDESDIDVDNDGDVVEKCGDEREMASFQASRDQVRDIQAESVRIKDKSNIGGLHDNHIQPVNVLVHGVQSSSVMNRGGQDGSLRVTGDNGANHINQTANDNNIPINVMISISDGHLSGQEISINDVDAQSVHRTLNNVAKNNNVNAMSNTSVVSNMAENLNESHHDYVVANMALNIPHVLPNVATYHGLINDRGLNIPNTVNTPITNSRNVAKVHGNIALSEIERQNAISHNLAGLLTDQIVSESISECENNRQPYDIGDARIMAGSFSVPGIMAPGNLNGHVSHGGQNVRVNDEQIQVEYISSNAIDNQTVMVDHSQLSADTSRMHNSQMTANVVNNVMSSNVNNSQMTVNIEKVQMLNMYNNHRVQTHNWQEQVGTSSENRQPIPTYDRYNNLMARALFDGNNENCNDVSVMAINERVMNDKASSEAKKQQELSRQRSKCAAFVRCLLDAAFHCEDLNTLALLNQNLQEIYKQFIETNQLATCD